MVPYSLVSLLLAYIGTDMVTSFLLSLPEPLCTFSLYEEFAVAQQAQGTYIYSLQWTIA